MTSIQSSPLAPDSRFDRLTPREARIALLALIALAVAGAIGSRNLGRIVERLPQGSAEGLSQGLGTDLLFYKTMIADVRGGKNYYDAGYVRLTEFGYPVSSTFNWRLPTYAWAGALLPNDAAIQGVLVAVALGALLLAFAAERDNLGFVRSAILVGLLVGVLRWSIDGYAYLTTEVWVSVLLTISASAMALADQAQQRERRQAIAWTACSLAAGIVALLLRELTLPYCVAACGIAWRHKRRWEAGVWLAGMLLFFVFLAWHGSEIASRCTPLERTSTKGPMEWVVVGGMNFVLMTARMHTFVYNAPGWLLFGYLFFSVVGLADSSRRHCTVLVTATLLYVGAFCIVGMDFNFYWGLMYASFLPFGLIRAPAALHALWRQATGMPAKPVVPQASN